MASGSGKFQDNHDKIKKLILSWMQIDREYDKVKAQDMKDLDIHW